MQIFWFVRIMHLFGLRCGSSCRYRHRTFGMMMAVLFAAFFCFAHLTAFLGTKGLFETQHFLHLACTQILAELIVELGLQLGQFLEAFKTLLCQLVQFCIGQHLAGLTLSGFVGLEQLTQFSCILAIGHSKLRCLLVAEHQVIGQTLDIELNQLFLTEFFTFTLLVFKLLCAHVSHKDGANGQNYNLFHIYTSLHFTGSLMLLQIPCQKQLCSIDRDDIAQVGGIERRFVLGLIDRLLRPYLRAKDDGAFAVPVIDMIEHTLEA